MASKPRKVEGWIPWIVGSGTAALVLLLGTVQAFDPFENSVWDLRVRTMAAPSPETALIDVILLDQQGLDWVQNNQGQGWPWDRRFFGLVADFVARGGAKATVFDVIFDQPSEDAGADQDFANSIRANGRVVLAESIESREQGLVGRPPTEELAQAAAILGHVMSRPDSDGTNRRIDAELSLVNGVTVPSLALAAWKLGHPGQEPLVRAGSTVLRYRGPQVTHRTFSVAEILRSEAQIQQGQTPDVDPQHFRGHYVFFGYSAQGLLDLRPSPVDNKYPGVYVHATHLDNLLAGDEPRVPVWYWTSLLVIVWSLGSAWAVARLKQAIATAPFFLAATGLPVAAGWLAYAAGWWWPVVPPVVAALVASLTMLLVNFAVEGRRRKFIQNAFGQYLSPQVIARLVEDPDQLQLGGEKRCLSIFFSDIAGFTSISERIKDDPVALTSLLNDYLSEMTSIIYAHGGTIDKYEGDAIIAFWNAPLDLPDHAAQAVRASLACQAKLAEIQPRLMLTAGRPVLARIGLNTGDVVIGNMGSHQRFNYTFLGDAGNLASRLEGINKLFDTRFLVSEFTKAAASEATDLYWREISRVRVVGKNLPVTVFEPLTLDQAKAKQPVLDSFAAALQSYYRGDFASAVAGFEALAGIDPPSARYLERTRELLQTPPEAWDGVWEAKEK